MKEPLTLYYDDTCRFCRSFVRFIQKRKTAQIIISVPIVNTTHEEKQIRDCGCVYSIVACIGKAEHEQDEAVIQILSRLTQPWPLFAILLKCIPRYIRKKGYAWVARNRYRILRSK